MPIDNLPFIGREYELDKLNLMTQKKTASCLVIKGRRRIGKSRLLLEFAKQQGTCYRFAGLSPEPGITAQHQREWFASKLQEQFNIPSIASDDWGDLFDWLGKLTGGGQVLIVFDEISWMAMDDETFLPKLKHAWDEYFNLNSRLILVLCGSVSTWIEKNILSSTGFFGRIAAEMTLEELSLPSCYSLLAALGFQGSAMEFFMILSLTGGVPWYLELMNPKLSASENIKQLCFVNDGILTKEYQKIFHDLFGKRGDIYRQIVNSISGGAKQYKEISEAIHYSSGGPLSEYLDELILSGFIRRDYSWQINSGNKKNISQYRLNDNYLRFYLKCIAPNITKIESNRFKNISLAALPQWSTLLGLQFENLVLHNRELIWKSLRIDPLEIINDNPYLQRKTKQHEGCQIDYLIQTKFNILYICECKFSQGKIGSDVIRELKLKIERLDRLNKFAVKPVLIYVGELTQDIVDSGFFAHLIDFSELLKS